MADAGLTTKRTELIEHINKNNTNIEKIGAIFDEKINSYKQTKIKELEDENISSAETKQLPNLELLKIFNPIEIKTGEFLASLESNNKAATNDPPTYKQVYKWLTKDFQGWKGVTKIAAWALIIFTGIIPGVLAIIVGSFAIDAWKSHCIHNRGGVGPSANDGGS